MSLQDLPIIMIRCLLLTILIEGIIALIIGIRDKKDLLNVALVNILTNPIVVSVPIFVMVFIRVSYRYYTLYILEILAFITEGFVYSKVLKYKKINPYLVSLILNLGSYLIGEILNKIMY